MQLKLDTSARGLAAAASLAHDAQAAAQGLQRRLLRVLTEHTHRCSEHAEAAEAALGKVAAAADALAAKPCESTVKQLVRCFGTPSVLRCSYARLAAVGLRMGTARRFRPLLIAISRYAGVHLLHPAVHNTGARCWDGVVWNRCCETTDTRPDVQIAGVQTHRSELNTAMALLATRDEAAYGAAQPVQAEVLRLCYNLEKVFDSHVHVCGRSSAAESAF